MDDVLAMVDFKANSLFLYWLMVAAEDLLEEAIPRTEEGSLKDYFIQHLEEERGHVAWQRDDLARLGVALVFDFRAAAIAGSQYYLIRHRHPGLLLGYMQALESRPMTLEMCAKIEAKYGPMRALRFHAEHDPGHALDLQRIIEQQEDDLREQIAANALWTKTWVMSVMHTFGQEDL